MIEIKYTKKNHGAIIQACAKALKNGKAVAYPTDTSYGLAVDATNVQAVKKLYKIKERGFKQPVHIVVPSLTYARKAAAFNPMAERLVKNFWPGALTLVLKLKAKNPGLKILCANTGFLGLRMPDNKIAVDLAKKTGRPITATSANPSAHLSGGFDSYSAGDVIKQFQTKKIRPDIIINAGKLPKRKPSTLVKIENQDIKILRFGPISEKQIIKISKKNA